VFLVGLFANNWQNKSHPTPQPSLSPSQFPSSAPSHSTPSPSATLKMTTTPSFAPSEGSSPSASSTPTQSFPFPSIYIPGFPITSPPVTLYPGEVREYNGTQLSSIGNVYENAIAGTQFINKTSYGLEVFGLVNKTVSLTYDDVIARHQIYQKVVTIYCVEGWDATILWEGVLVKDLIQEAGPTPNASTVIFHASDGYSTALPVEYLEKNNILLAYKMNNLTIPPERGFPFQLVAESKYGYKWIKWVTGIEFSNSTSYLGYWESRGYSNDATIP
jgi:DMSO/TMAO reductase YedYZ molybdopterin-dependent catalytic subunit